MFWQMDKGYHEADFWKISRYLLSVFEFAAGSGKSVFDKTDWMAFSKADGAWMYTLYDKHSKNGTAMRQSVDKLFLMGKAERKKIFDAIAHDMEFTEDLSAGFQFESILLGRTEQKLIKDFFIYFYEEVLCHSHFRLSFFHGRTFNRREFAEEFFQGNNKHLQHICPVCLQTTTNAKREEDVEHYFPKSAVPCLVLHPHNVYFCCSACNQKYKLTQNQLQQKGKNIRELFLPYFDTIRDKVQIEFKNEPDRDKVAFVPADPDETGINKKIAAFDQLFSLEERWSGLLPLYYLTRVKEYEKLLPMSMPDLQKEMKRDLRKYESAVEERPERYLESRHWEWLTNTQMKAFYANITQKGCAVVLLP